MKRRIAFALCLVLLLSLAACGGSGVSSFGVQSAGEKNILVTANHAVTDSTGRTMLTVGENEQVTIRTDFNKDAQIKVCLALGDFTSGTLPEERVETVVSGGDSASFTIEAGEYTVEVITINTLTGTADIVAEPVTITAGSGAE